MRGKWLLFGGTTILLAVAAGALSVYRQSAAKKPAPKPAATAATSATSSSVEEISLSGVIEAQRVVSVPIPIDGTVETFGAEVGQDVFEGQLIAHIRNIKLDNAVETATLEYEKVEKRVHDIEGAIVVARLEASRARADASRARSEFDRADKAYQRQQMLIREGATPRLVFEKSQRDFNTAKEELESKEILARQAEDRVDMLNRDLDAAKKIMDERSGALDQAKSDVAAGDVRSPVDGIVLGRRGQAGDEVNPAMGELCRIAVTLSALEISIQPQPSLIPRVAVGMPAAIHVAESAEAIAGSVREIRDGRVIVDFTSPTPAIKPGMSAQVQIKLR